MVQQLAARKPKLRWVIIGGCLLSLIALVVALSMRSQYAQTNAAAEAISVSQPLPAVTGSHNLLNSDEHPLDPVLAMARQALLHVQEEVADYRGRLIKRERIQGVLGGEVQMEFKIRTRRAESGKITRPLSAYLKFLQPGSARGREITWIEGANGNKLTAHEGGFLNVMRVELEPTGMLAMMDNKYPITEIGFARLIEKLIEKGERDRKIGPCDVQIVEGQHVGERECRLVQVTHAEQDSRFDFHIAQIFIDTERLIPLRYAAFLWPQEPGGEPLLEEEYTYLDVELNAGLNDADFDPNNSSYKFPKR